MNLPLCTDLDALEADVAILGLTNGDPYTYDEFGAGQDQVYAPTAVRAESARISMGPRQYDFDLGGTTLDGREVRVVDCGDVPGDHHEPRSHYPRAEAAARKIIGAGAMIVSIGGDHGVPITVFRAFEGRGPITLVHIDAHLDWRDGVNGAREGYSSPIRRAAELDWFDSITQIGQRPHQGRARRRGLRRRADHRQGAARDRHERGAGAHPRRRRTLPHHRRRRYGSHRDAGGGRACAGGGVTYNQTVELIHGLVAKVPVVGMDIVEITPKRDLNGITALTAGRLIVNLIGAAVRARQFERG